jgi:hypothetical protein
MQQTVVGHHTLASGAERRTWEEAFSRPKKVRKGEEIHAKGGTGIGTQMEQETAARSFYRATVSAAQNVTGRSGTSIRSSSGVISTGIVR